MAQYPTCLSRVPIIGSVSYLSPQGAKHHTPMPGLLGALDCLAPRCPHTCMGGENGCGLHGKGERLHLSLSATIVALRSGLWGAFCTHLTGTLGAVNALMSSFLLTHIRACLQSHINTREKIKHSRMYARVWHKNVEKFAQVYLQKQTLLVAVVTIGRSTYHWIALNVSFLMVCSLVRMNTPLGSYLRN